jgi:uncharacterized protein (TIGR02453 family)
MPFAGLRSEAPAFFAELEQDNSKDLFAANRDRYEERVRRPFLDLLAALPGDPERWRVYRPTRDTRFAKDKTPYKTFIGAIGPGPAAVGRYVMVDARGLLVATGAPMLAPDQLDRYRAAVDGDAGSQLAAIVDELRQDGHHVKPGRHEPLRTAPRGYPRDHRRIELLRWRGVEVSARLGTPAWLETVAAPERITATWDVAADLEAWLDLHVGASDLPPEEIWAKGRRR